MILGIGNGVLLADEEPIYETEDLRVGLFAEKVLAGTTVQTDPLRPFGRRES